MNSLGLDIASNTGWSILNEKKELVEFGSIQINSQMTLPQKLIFLGNELKRIFNKYKIDYVFIEDLICGISGVKTLSYLARLNGVAIYISTESVNNNIYLYNPSEWKKNSFNGLIGSSKKWEIQLKVVEYYKLKFNISEEELKIFTQQKYQCYDTIEKQEKMIGDIKTEINDGKKKLSSKRNPCSESDKILLDCKIDELNSDLVRTKKLLLNLQKQIDKDLNKLSLQITSRTGIDQNIADSIAINFCGLQNIHKKGEKL